MTSDTEKFYGDAKGFGFIQPDGSRDAFIPANAPERVGRRSPDEDRKPSSDEAEDRRSGEIPVDIIKAAWK